MTQAAQDFVRYALAIGAIELIPEGRPLKSGRLSPYFFNSGCFNTGTSLEHLARAYADALVSTQMMNSIDTIFGPPYKGTVLAPAVALALSRYYDLNIGYTSNRKEAKNHGEGGILLGHPITEAMRVAVVDDVMTTGSSIESAIELVESLVGIAVCCVIGFDRQERGMGETTLSAAQEFTGKTGIPVYAAATLNDLVDVLESRRSSRSDAADPILEKIYAYRERYGALVDPDLSS